MEETTKPENVFKVELKFDKKNKTMKNSLNYIRFYLEMSKIVLIFFMLNLKK